MYFFCIILIFFSIFVFCIFVFASHIQDLAQVLGLAGPGGRRGMARSSLAQVLYYYIIYYIYHLLIFIIIIFFIIYQYLLLSSRKSLIPILDKYFNSKGMSASRPSPRPLKASLPTHLVFIAIVQILVGQCHHRHHHHHHHRHH